MDFGSPSSLVLEQSMTADQDQIHLTYQTDALGLSAEEIQALPVSDRLRPAINVLDLAPVLELPVTFMLHPINLFCDQGCASQDRLSRGAGNDGATQSGIRLNSCG